MKKQKKTTKVSSAKKSKRTSNGGVKRSRAVKVKQTAGLTIADPFSGGGGMRLAFQAVGLACAWACEINRYAARVYKANFGDDPTGDITAVKAHDIPDFDILCAGFPCQSHSLQGKRRGMNDPRGRLIYHILRILRAKQPKACVLENVENFMHIDGGQPFANLKAQLEGLGYEVHHAVLDARNFGVAQSRRRLFIVAILRSVGAKAFRFPEGERPATNLQEILEPDADVPERFNFSETYRNSLLRAKDMNRVKGSNHGFMFAKRTHFNILMSRESGTEKNVIIRPDGTWRRPTPLEYKRAMGFPENYDLSSVSVGRRYNLLGNSVAVPVVKAIAERLVAALTGKTPSRPRPTGRVGKGNPINKPIAATAVGAPVQKCRTTGNGGTAPSPLAWYGAKNKHTSKIVSVFPPHRTYVEPFFGGGSVFFAKPPSKVETVNDMNGDLMNFFRMLRDRRQRKQLIELLEATPWAREQFCDALVAMKVGKWTSDVERAWTFLVATRQSRNGVAKCPGDWSRTVGRTGNGASSRTSMWRNLPERLAVAGLRLKHAQIECGHWAKILDDYDSEDTLAYLDPPYVHSTRNPSNRNSYDHEMTDVDHARLLLRLKEFKGKVVLSGYASSLYDQLLSGWHRIEIETTSSASNKANKKHAKRTEVLWLNYTPAVANAA